MLIKDFYTVVKVTLVEKELLHAHISLNKRHKIFEGHFPGNPVTPGVCMIQIIKEIVEKHLEKKLFLERISNVKFTALINPHVNPELLMEVSIAEIDGVVKVKNISKFADGVIALKCNGTFILG
ncbi:hotdog family protein [Aquimarina sediminis]|uniref:3-hydroxyacyl-ACP dehydratase n=1 Tax=Aquimarina sediminis TaxID=2070536 RepID=UPI000CA079FD|nr:3-hydroxyacyl-ACP dehydratase [Aquimarina sediminis]